jgi:hypothetical protein
MTMFVATQYSSDIKAFRTYDADAKRDSMPSLDDLLAEVNSAFESPFKERPMTTSTYCSSTSDGASAFPSRPTTAASSVSQVSKVDWNVPGGIDNATSVTTVVVAPSPPTPVAKPENKRFGSMITADADREEPVLSYSPPPRREQLRKVAKASSVRATPEMIDVQGVWFSMKGNREPVEVMIVGDIVTFASGAEAKLVARHEQFWLTSETGKHYLSADVSEDGNGSLAMNWTDGSTWSRLPMKSTKNEVQQQTKIEKTLKDESCDSDSGVRKSPKMLRKLKKTFGMLKGSTKIQPLRRSSISDVQGTWLIDSSAGQVEVVVDGSSVTWSTGSKAMLVARNGQFMLTSPSGKIYLTGEEKSQGALSWTNGSTWKRPADWIPGKPMKASAAWTELETEQE